MLNLPRDPRGAPIPWFAARDAEGHLRVTLLDRAKKRGAPLNRRCWMCGHPLGRSWVFVLGPLQAITRTVTEPPSHPSCAEYAVRVCPFLSNPARDRYDLAAIPNGPPQNPGVFVLWTTRSFELAEERGKLVVGDPVRITWWTRGRRATDAEIAVAQAVASKFVAKE
jgi:hypothetical protein